MNRKYKQLTDKQRYQIEAYLKAEKSHQFIADQLGIHRSTLYRELKRNCSKRGNYTASRAQMLSDERKERYGRGRRFTGDKQQRIKKYLEQEQWSPKQIVGYCSANNIPMVSHERIYQYIREDKAKGGKMYMHLRHRLKHHKRPTGKRIAIKNRISIEERPEIVNTKGRFGDWEIDTIIGKNNKGAIVTIVERTTSFFIMRKLPKGKNAKGLSKEVIELLIPYKENVRSITSDNGTEFADHQTIAEKLQTTFYFAHPYSSWERGLNEYTNKLIRQYIDKKSCFDQFTDKQITDIQHKINRRPREKLNFKSPKSVFFNLVA